MFKRNHQLPDNSATPIDSGGAKSTLGGLRSWHSNANIWIGLVSATLFINLLGLVFPIALLQTYDRVIPNQAWNTLKIFVVLVIIAVIIQVVLRVLRSVIVNWADARFEFIMGNRVFRHYLGAKLSELEKQGPGVHLEHLNVINRLKGYYGGQVLIILLDMPFSLIYIALVAYLSTWLALVPLTIAILMTIYARFLGIKMRTWMERRRINDDRRISFLIELLAGVHSMKALALERLMLRRYERLQDKGANINYYYSMLNAMVSNLGQLASFVVMVAVAGLGSIMVVKGMMSMGALAACVLLSNRALQPIAKSVSVWGSVAAVKVAEKSVQQVSEIHAEVESGAPLANITAGGIQMKNVCFTYPNGAFSLRNLTIDIKPGETIGLTGDSLEGKTTFLWLMMGLLRPSSGEVLIDGHNLHQYDAREMRQSIAYLSKEAVLFTGTVLENITLFRPEKTEKALEIADQVGLTEVMGHFSQGYNTIVGARSVEVVPRGIKQLIAFVRSLVDEPKILLFDEANAGVDMRSDQRLKQVLESVHGKQTTIIVSYRPSLLKLADRLLVLKSGEIERVVNGSRTENL